MQKVWNKKEWNSCWWKENENKMGNKSDKKEKNLCTETKGKKKEVGKLTITEKKIFFFL